MRCFSLSSEDLENRLRVEGQEADDGVACPMHRTLNLLLLSNEFFFVGLDWLCVSICFALCLRICLSLDNGCSH